MHINLGTSDVPPGVIMLDSHSLEVVQINKLLGVLEENDFTC